MKNLYLIAGLSAALLLSSNSFANGLGVGLKAGTLGAGMEITKGFSPKINGRLGFNTLTLDKSATESGINYNIDLELSSVTALIDWHPTGGSFRTTAGIISNGNQLNMRAETAATYDIGGTTYTAAQIGTLTGRVGFDDLAPYIGIGWGNAVEDGQGLTLSLDLGVVVQGNPNVDLNTTSTVAGLDASLQVEEQQLEQDLEDFNIYPVVTLGMAWQF